MLHEDEWSQPAAQLTITDIVDAEKAARIFGEDHCKEPILFFPLSTLRFVVARVQAHFRDVDAPPWQDLLAHLRRRAALLLTFPFDRETLDVDAWTKPHEELYVASFAAVHELMSVFDAMETELQRPPDEPTWCDEEHEDNEATLDHIVDFVMNKCQGDRLPSLLLLEVAEEHVCVGQREAFFGRKPDVQAPTSLAVIHEFGGRELARRVQDTINKPIAELRNTSTMVHHVRGVCCAYLAKQKHQPVPRVQYSVRHRAWRCEGGDGGDGLFHRSGEAALACFLRRQWPPALLATCSSCSH